MKKLIYKIEEDSRLKKNFRNIKMESLYFWQKWLNLGVHSDNNYEYNVRLRVLNLSSLLFLCLSLTHDIFFLNLGRLITYFFLIQFFLVGFSFVFLNKKDYVIGKYFSLFSQLLFLVNLNILYGDDSGFIFYYLPLFLFNYLIFSPGEKKYANIYSTILIFFVFAGIFFEASSGGSLKPRIFSNTVYYLNLTLGAILFIIVFFALFKMDNKKESQDQKLVKLLQDEIIQRQKTEESWNDAIQLQMEIMNSIPSDVFILDQNASIFRLNHVKEPFIKDSILEIPGFGIGTNFLEYADLIYKNSSLAISSLIHAVNEVLKGTSIFQELEFNAYKEKEIFWYKLKISKIENETFQGLFLMLVNSTESKKARDMLEKMEKLNMVFQSINSDFIFNINSEGNISDILSEKDSSLKKSSFLKRSIYDLGLPDKIVNEILETVRQSLRYGNMHTIKYETETNDILENFEVKVVGIDEKDAFAVIKKIPN